MFAPYICSQCRHKILSGASQLRASSFVSLGKLVKQDQTATPFSKQLLTEESPKGNEHDAGTLEATNATEPTRVTPSPDISRRTKPDFRPGRRPSNRKRKENGALESLFSSSLSSNPGSFEGAIAATIPPARQLVQEDLAALRHKYYKQSFSLKIIWGLCLALFRSKHWQTFQKEAVDIKAVVLDPEHIGLFRGFLYDVAASRARDPARNNLSVAPGDVIKIYRHYGISDHWWDGVLGRQVEIYIQRYLYPNDRVLDHRVHESEAATAVLNDIVQVWWAFVFQNGQPSEFDRRDYHPGHADKPPNRVIPRLSGRYRWPGLSFIYQELSVGEPLPANITKRFTELWPNHHGTLPQTNALSMAAIMTLDILEHRKASLGGSDSLWTNAEPFMQALARLVHGCSVQTELANSYFIHHNVPATVRLNILERWAALGVDFGPKEQESSDEPPSTAEPELPAQVTSPGSYNNPLMTALSLKLVRARDKGDALYVSQLWSQFQNLQSPGAGDSVLRDDLYSNFLTSFFAVRVQHRAVEVWNYMINNGHQPTQKHWHAMLAGCCTAKELISLREIWANMQSAGVKPDTKSWTTWINGLMLCGDWPAGIQALDALGKEWKASRSGEGEGLKPSLPPIHATLTGLAHNSKTDLTPRIHDFAKAHGLTYDTQSYNILLRPAVRANDDATVKSLFASMRAANCQPDIATFTIILNGLLSNPTSPFHTQSHAEQQSAVFSILNDMKSTGLNANTHTYSTILDGLLRPEIMNLDAAAAVMQHMAEHNVRASPHIYTILITHYFALNPPDLAAIASLLHRAQLERVSLDPIFYGRMIENYARVGETEKMLIILRRMPEEGKTPGWMALLACLRALVKSGEWDAVRDLIRDVKSEDGLFRHGNGAWKGKDAFWELVGSVREGGFLG